MYQNPLLLAVRSHLSSGDLGRGVPAVDGVGLGEIPQPLLGEDLRALGGLHGAPPAAVTHGPGQVLGAPPAALFGSVRGGVQSDVHLAPAQVLAVHHVPGHVPVDPHAVLLGSVRNFAQSDVLPAPDRVQDDLGAAQRHELHGVAPQPAASVAGAAVLGDESVRGSLGVGVGEPPVQVGGAQEPVIPDILLPAMIPRSVLTP